MSNPIGIAATITVAAGHGYSVEIGLEGDAEAMVDAINLALAEGGVPAGTPWEIIDASGFGPLTVDQVSRFSVEYLAAMAYEAEYAEAPMSAVGTFLNWDCPGTVGGVHDVSEVHDFSAVYMGGFTSMAEFARHRAAEEGHLADWMDAYVDWAGRGESLECEYALVDGQVFCKS